MILIPFIYNNNKQIFLIIQLYIQMLPILTEITNISQIITEQNRQIENIVAYFNNKSTNTNTNNNTNINMDTNINLHHSQNMKNHNSLILIKSQQQCGFVQVSAHPISTIQLQGHSNSIQGIAFMDHCDQGHHNYRKTDGIKGVLSEVMSCSDQNQQNFDDKSILDSKYGNFINKNTKKNSHSKNNSSNNSKTNTYKTNKSNLKIPLKLSTKNQNKQNEKSSQQRTQTPKNSNKKNKYLHIQLKSEQTKKFTISFPTSTKNITTPIHINKSRLKIKEKYFRTCHSQKKNSKEKDRDRDKDKDRMGLDSNKKYSFNKYSNRNCNCASRQKKQTDILKLYNKGINTTIKPSNKTIKITPTKYFSSTRTPQSQNFQKTNKIKLKL